MHHFDDEDSERSVMRGCTDKKRSMVIDDNMIEKLNKNRNMRYFVSSLLVTVSATTIIASIGLKRGQPNTILIFVGVY